MVNPVTSQNATKRDVYLPAIPSGQANATWYDFWTGHAESAGKNISAEAPIDILPLYIRPGAILPMGPLVQFANEKPNAPIELRIYPGADGTFTLYEDDGHTYAYEKGAHATIPLTWNQATQTLTIGKREGTYPGLINERAFNIFLVKENHGAGVGPEDHPDQTVTYSGDPITIKANDH
jgi:alpha-D-xyloside xylohydrolase